ncbi:putative nucleoside transporter [Escherichia coli]|nr:putative nucleoside transporter [Escherichia coli]
MMIGYAGMGVPIDYLLAASLMAIPGGILFARILSPATEPSQVTFEICRSAKRRQKALSKQRRAVR